ncbi:polyadenylate-binding protein RBP47-like [Phalaenopsis equestris]|uniref:polyadenylate-binding protein RBP47-like n=1 Tax=Phalaenopsis equestris TaxID=78828 RepID=UPI0009E5ECA4|nr:polyadenylate-binding protein RBP47-like [Phalaenopsis equestris]
MQPPANAGELQKNKPLQQPWMPIQYPAAAAAAAAMAMQHQMMGIVPPSPAQFAPHYLAYPTPPPPPPQYHQPAPLQTVLGGWGPSSGEENKSIWVGDLHYWMDENYLHSCFGHTGEVVAIKVIRNKQTGQSEGYGFVEFCTHAAAEKVLQTFNGHLMPNAEHPFRLNWASFSMGDRRSDATSDYSIFVGDLTADVTDTMLQETFATRYTSVKGAKVVIDANTGRSKGYGFVRFGDDNEKTLAMTEMNGVYCSSRPMRIGAATPRKSSAFGSNGSSLQGYPPDGDSTNTTVFVGGLDPAVTEDDLKQTFSQFGDIASVKIPVGKHCGFVQFVYRSNAEEALQSLNGTIIGKQAVRLSWGRNPVNRQLRADLSSPWNGLYYGPQMYGGYGFAIPPHDPMTYAAAYGGYPMYGNQQQVS